MGVTEMVALLCVLLLLILGVVVAAPDLLGIDLRTWLADRLRGGESVLPPGPADVSVTRSFAEGVIQALELLGEFREQLAEQYPDGEPEDLGGALARLEAAQTQLELLLGANQVESFVPEVGARIEEDRRRYESASHRPAPTPEAVGCVAAVEQPGWVLVLGDGVERVIREARVCVYGECEEGGETSSAH